MPRRRTVPAEPAAPPPTEQRRPGSTQASAVRTKPAGPAYHHGNLRSALIENGLRLLESQGIDALSVRRLAREAGVTQSAPLHHFGDKQGLLAAIAARGFELLIEHRRGILDRSTDPHERLMNIMLGHLVFATGHPALFHLMFGPTIDRKTAFAELVDMSTRSYGILQACVAGYLGQIGQPADRGRPATMAVWTACHGLAMITIDRLNTPADRAYREPMRVGREVFGIVLDGLRQAR